MMIYSITNKVNGKRYVGLTTTSLAKRWSSHIRSAHREGSKCTALAHALIKYGKENFVTASLEEVSQKELLGEREKYWIEKLQTIAPDGYNLRSGGDYGYVQNPESNEKNRQAHLGKKHSEESKKKMSIQNTGAGNAFFGKRHSEESIQKMSEKRALRVRTPDLNLRVKESLKFFANSPEGKALAKRRAKASVETRAKKFVLHSPTGEKFEGHNLKQFASEHGLLRSKLSEVLAGKRSHHKKWTKEPNIIED